MRCNAASHSDSGVARLKILVVEDHGEVARWLAHCALSAYPGAETVVCATVAQAQAAIDRQRFELALLDIQLPDGSGISIAALLAQQQPDTYSVMATIFDDDAHLFDALKAGARGYLLKDQEESEFIAALRDIRADRPPISPAIARRMIDYFNRCELPAPRGVTLDLDEFGLSGRETEVLLLLAKGVSRKEVARLIGISPHTVAGYVKTLYRKLAVCSRAEAAVIAQRAGLV